MKGFACDAVKTNAWAEVEIWERKTIWSQEQKIQMCWEKEYFFDGGTKNRMAGRIKLVSNMGPGSPGNDGTSESKAENARLCQKFRILNSWS